MATKIIHKKSSVAGSVPSSGDLNPGELAVNLADRIIYSKTTGGDVIEMGVTNATAIVENCKNVSGGTLTKGTPVYQSGTSGNAMQVQAAEASTASSMPAIGILSQDLADEAEGTLVLSGFIQGIDTSSFNAGDTLYIASNGGLTSTVPSGELKAIQNIAKVVKVHANNGSLVVTGAGRSNATPNLNENRIFIGNSNGQSSIAELKANLLTDVDTTTIEPEEAYVLTWNDTDEVWEPRAVPASTNVSLGSWSLGSSTAVGWSVGESSGKIVFRYGTTSAMTVDGDGNVVLDGTLYANNGTIGGTTDPDVTGTDWGYHDVGTDFYFQYGSTNMMKLTSTGDLYVVGDVNVNATLSGTTSSSYYFRDGSGAQLEITTAGVLYVAGSIDA